MQEMVTSAFHNPDNQTNSFSFWNGHKNDFEDRRSEFFNKKIYSLKNPENSQELKEKDRPSNFTHKNSLLRKEDFAKKTQERQNIVSVRNKYAYVKSKTDSNIESLNLKRRKLKNTSFVNESNKFFLQHGHSVDYLQRQRNVMSALPANRVNFFQIESSLKPHYRSKSAISLRSTDKTKENESSSKLVEVDNFHNDSFNKYFKQDNLKPLLNNFNSNFQQNEMLFENLNKSYIEKDRYSQLSSRFGNSLNENISMTNSTTENSVLLAFLRDDPQMKSWSYNMNMKLDKDSDPIKYSGPVLVDTSNRDNKSSNDVLQNSSTLSTEYSSPIQKKELLQKDKTDNSHEVYHNKYNSHLEIKNKMLSLLDSLNLHTLKSNIIEIERRTSSSGVAPLSGHNSTLDIYHFNKHDPYNWDHLRNRPLVKNKKSVRVALENNRLHCYTPEYDKPKLSSVYT